MHGYTIVPDTVEYWLSRCRAVTEAHVKKQGSTWSLNDQIAHAHSEVAEVYQAVRHGESPERVLEEICDSIYSALTMAHIAGFTDSEVMDELETVLRKIEGRQGLDKKTQAAQRFNVEMNDPLSDS